MTVFRCMRSAAVAIVVGGVAALAGCGGTTAPTKPADKPADAKPIPATSSPAGPATPAPAAPSHPAALTPLDPAQQAAGKFLADLQAASAKPEPLTPELMKRVSPTFLKAIGKPLLTDADKSRGYSPGAAEAWLRRAGAALAGAGPATGYGSAAAAIFTGPIGNGTGHYLIRMVPAEGGWKADRFQVGNGKTSDTKVTGVDGPFQEFAAQAFLDALTGGPMPREDRVLSLGAILSPKARAAWRVTPGGQDKDRGYEFNPAALGLLADRLTAGLTAVTRTPSGPDQFKVELTRAGTTTAYALKLVKGPSPGEWLVDEFAPQ